MRFRPANISLINRRHYLPRLLLTLSLKYENENHPTDLQLLTGSHHISSGLPTIRPELKRSIISIVGIQARIFILLATGAPVGVVIRRGPSTQVLLIKWDLERDTFEHGQWLKARVYERRCDLSPDGNLLLYFASDQRRAMSSWTAVSCPPYFTALALCPKTTHMAVAVSLSQKRKSSSIARNGKRAKSRKVSQFRTG